MDASASSGPRISICLPHWEVEPLAKVCLRSIRKFTRDRELEVIVVDNGSKDASLEYLRSLEWIRLLERPEEGSQNFPDNVFTAWDLGLQHATGEYFVTMHTDVFVKRDGWLDPFLREMAHGEEVAGAGAWKLFLEHPLYTLQKKVFHKLRMTVKRAFGDQRRYGWKQGHYPRDYCAMYRRAPLVEHGMTFHGGPGEGGGYKIAKQIWDAGLQTRMFPVQEMYENVVHVAHGTIGVAANRPVKKARTKRRAAKRAAALLAQPWVKELQADTALDQA